MEDWQKKGLLGIVADVASKTLGFDLIGTKPMSEEERAKYQKTLREEREVWERQHPEIVEAWKKHALKTNTKKPYILAPWEKELVKEILKMPEDILNTCDITIMDDGDISVRTCRQSWMALAGREWWVNLKEKTSICIAMN